MRGASGSVLPAFSDGVLGHTKSGVAPYEDRTLVIRILFRWEAEIAREIMDLKIRSLGRQIADTVAAAEKEVWISRYSHVVDIFRPSRIIA